MRLQPAAGVEISWLRALLPWWGWLLAAALSYMLGSETWWWMVCAAPVTNAIRMRQADAATFEAEEAAESAAAGEDKKAS